MRDCNFFIKSNDEARTLTLLGRVKVTNVIANSTAKPHMIDGIALVVDGSIILNAVVGTIKTIYPIAMLYRAFLRFGACRAQRMDNNVPTSIQP